MKYSVMQLTPEEAVIQSMRGNMVYMIDLSLFENNKEIYYMPLGELVSLIQDHDVVFIMLQEDLDFGSVQNV